MEFKMSLEHKDNLPFEDGYFDRINMDILKKIPIYPKKIVEVGCGAGALGAKYKEINPRCQYIGIELSKDACDYAIKNKRIDSVFCANIEEKDLTEFDIAKNSLDCIIYGDVLEHLINPWEIIKNHSNYLKQNGLIISCIPNISNYSIIYQLLKGNWNYQEEGLLDRTHLRFFTLKTIKDMFEKAGLNIVDVEGLCYNLEAHSSFIRIMEQVFPSLGLKTEEVKSNTQVYQYVIVAQRSNK